MPLHSLVVSLELPIGTLGTLEPARGGAVATTMSAQTGRANPEPTLVTSVPEEIPGLFLATALAWQRIVAVLIHLYLLVASRASYTHCRVKLWTAKPIVYLIFRDRIVAWSKAVYVTITSMVLTSNIAYLLEDFLFLPIFFV